jgi:regulatory protein
MMREDDRRPPEAGIRTRHDNGLDSGVDTDPESMARAIVLRKLSAAPQTRAQLDRTLAKKGVPEDVRNRVLDRFSEVNLIDDAAYAAAWVESRHTGRGLARRALGHELRQRGVDQDVVDHAVRSLPAEQEEAMARELVEKRLPGTRRLDAAARTRRLLGMLARKGYPPGLAYRVVRDALEAEGVDESELPSELLE